MNRKIYRQGDVLIEQVDAIPAGAAPSERKGRWVLAEGEATGHMHSVAAEDATLLVHGVEMYLRIHAETQVTHQEHAPITLPPGDYRIGRQREYDPAEVRRVAD